MAVVMVTKRGHANEVHRQTEAAHNEQLSEPLGLPALDDPLHGLYHNFNADEHQKNAIRKAAERLDLSEAIREARTRRPFARHRSKQANSERNTVEEHVYAVAQQAKRICDVAVEGLDCHKEEVQAV